MQFCKLLLSLVACQQVLVYAHNGVDHHSKNVTAEPYPSTHLHGMPILQRPDLTPGQVLYWSNYNTTTYFTTSLGNRGAFKYHVATLGFVLVFWYPICLVLNNVGSNWYIPALTLNTFLLITSLLALSIFSNSFPEDWYPHNAYRKISWILFILTIIHYCNTIVYRASKWITLQDIELESTFIPLQNLEHSDAESSNVATPPSADLELQDSLRSKHFSSSMTEKRDHFLYKFFQNRIVQKLASTFGSTSKIIFHSLNYLFFLFLMVDVAIGLAVGNLFGKGIRIFNLLAHWIKGGVFIVLGIVSLSRYCGFGAKYGWAWNRTIIYKKDVTSTLWDRLLPRGTITMEALESFLIFFYGSTNVFLEHLAGAGGAWTAKDLQHVSIAFMYIGAGLCGLLTEIKLNNWKFDHVMKTLNDNINPSEIAACSPGYSPNPFPTFTIFWTGILMSQHAQASETSTKIHVQWGSLLSYGSFFRLLTFVILFLVPNTDPAPAKPFTELITSFCMLCGGLIFMESTDQVVEAMEYRGFTPMFTFNMSVGIVSLVMAWQMILFLWKDSLKERITH